MAVLPILDSWAGPLPQSATFKSPTDAGGALIEVTGSVWGNTPNVMIGIQILIDGNVAGNAQIFSNNQSVHRTVVPVFIKAPQDFAQHKITLQAMNSHTVSDTNDFYTVVLHY